MIHPEGFTALFVFRSCEQCGTINVVKDEDYTCAVCGWPLRRGWRAALQLRL